MQNRKRRGSALLEVMIALVMLATLGTGMITLLGQTSHSMRAMNKSERLARGAAAIIDRVSVLSREAMLARVGRTIVDGWTIDVTQRSPALFDVSVSETDHEFALAQTTFYRPDSADVAR